MNDSTNFLSVFQGATCRLMFSELERPIPNLWKTDIDAPDARSRFQICSLFSRPDRLEGEWRRKSSQNFWRFWLNKLSQYVYSVYTALHCHNRCPKILCNSLKTIFLCPFILYPNSSKIPTTFPSTLQWHQILRRSHDFPSVYRYVSQTIQDMCLHDCYVKL